MRAGKTRKTRPAKGTAPAEENPPGERTYNCAACGKALMIGACMRMMQQGPLVRCAPWDERSMHLDCASKVRPGNKSQRAAERMRPPPAEPKPTTVTEHR